MIYTPPGRQYKRYPESWTISKTYFRFICNKMQKVKIIFTTKMVRFSSEIDRLVLITRWITSSKSSLFPTYIQLWVFIFLFWYLLRWFRLIHCKHMSIKCHSFKILLTWLIYKFHFVCLFRIWHTVIVLICVIHIKSKYKLIQSSRNAYFCKVLVLSQVHSSQHYYLAWWSLEDHERHKFYWTAVPSRKTYYGNLTYCSISHLAVSGTLRSWFKHNLLIQITRECTTNTQIWVMESELVIELEADENFYV